MRLFDSDTKVYLHSCEHSMTIEICCTLITLISLATSDFSQTATFTSMDYHEANPILRPLVQGRNSYGEIAIGIATVGSIFALEELKQSDRASATTLEWIAIAGHSLAVWHNEALGFKAPMVVFPVIVGRW